MRPLLLVAVLLAAACRGPASDRLPELSVDPDPLLSIGMQEGDPEHLLHRVTGLLMQSDGTLILANSGTHEIRAYDGSGRHRWTSGRQGDGPGEFSGDLSLALAPEDTIVVFDWLARRITTLAPDGSVSATSQVLSDLPNIRMVGALADGELVMTARHLRLSPGLNPDSVSYHVLARGGSMTELAHFPGSRVYLYAGAGLPAVEGQPFGARTSAVVAGEILAVATGEEPTIVLLTPTGVRDTLRWVAEPRLVTEELIADWRRHHMEMSSLPAAVRGPWMEQVPLPTYLPFADGLLSDTQGRFWVRQWAPRDEGAPWLVLSRRGRIEGRISFPAGFEPSLVRNGQVVGVHTDEFGVERVRSYGIVRD